MTDGWRVLNPGARVPERVRLRCDVRTFFSEGKGEQASVDTFVVVNLHLTFNGRRHGRGLLRLAQEEVSPALMLLDASATRPVAGNASGALADYEVAATTHLNDRPAWRDVVYGGAQEGSRA